ncbi:MAG TPA: hypothetical protein PLW39_11040 [Thermoflexales bacterium]|nr:hypothetical protein [Thermoflexales bacterium]HQW35950.1 hypothetical protein [Thermoflexales bacterium]HQZ22789.1 hypothetical protein [Thermoflexales bacterium]
MKTYRYVLIGLGNVGRNFLEMVHAREQKLRDEYGVELVCVGVADSTGCLSDANGLDVSAIASAKKTRRGVVLMPGGKADKPQTLLDVPGVNLVLDASPTNLEHGQPGLDLTRAALKKGIPVIAANKGPLALAFQELAKLSDLKGSGPALRFSGAVGGAVPSINVGRRDLAGGLITRVEAALNGTTQLILGMMMSGASFEAALAEAQRIGIAEPDPSLDVDGWDLANKLVIIANAVLNQPTVLENVSVAGIRGVGADMLQRARSQGGRVSLLAVANWNGKKYDLSVEPMIVPVWHPLSKVGSERLDEMGVIFYSDIYGRMQVICAEEGPGGTAAAMLRDVLSL